MRNSRVRVEGMGRASGGRAERRDSRGGAGGSRLVACWSAGGVAGKAETGGKLPVDGDSRYHRPSPIPHRHEDAMHDTPITAEAIRTIVREELERAERLRLEAEESAGLEERLGQYHDSVALRSARALRRQTPVCGR
jgi:hypothetical protein